MWLESIRRSVACALVVLCSLASSAFAQTPATDCHIEWAPMRDGVKLATEVYLPTAQKGRLPVVLQRTPYNRFPPGPGSNCDSAAFAALAARGYAVLNQDVRGRYRSQGTMNALVQEANDGYDDHWTYVDSVFDLWFGQSWLLLTFAGEQYMRNLEASGASPAEVQAKTATWEAQGYQDILTKWVWQLPLTSFGV